MKRLLGPSFLALALLLCACKTTTVETRRVERSGSYSQLGPDFKSLVDQGRIKIGMPSDAVYIAWGKPSQILQGESSEGFLTTWVYLGTTYQEYRYWGYGPFYHPGCSPYYWSGPYLERDYIPRSYVKAEVVFDGDTVKSWRTLPRPGY